MYILGGWSFFFFGCFFLFYLVLGFNKVLISFDFGSFFSSELVDLLIYLDIFSCCFLLVLSFMVSSVFFFSSLYMESEVNNNRFFIVVLLFVFSMGILMVSPSFMFFLMGWDGLGFTSFLLVAWFGCFSSRSASVKTFLVNRFGDSLFLVSALSLFYQGHFNLYVLDSSMGWYVLFLFTFATFTKSAQYPFSSWLPAAMAAPTPVSSLVHSSTLVTAGVYFLIRYYDLFFFEFSYLISLFGLFTMFFSSFCAIVEMDLKKIVAYSTLSQLGFMVFCLGVKLVGLSFFYLLVHACFKALMFISVGVSMVYSGHSQDVRSVKKMWSVKPLMFLNLFMSVVSLSGMPFLSGFMFKDKMLYCFNLGVMKFGCVFLFFLSIFFTVVYSFRLFSLIYSSSYIFLSVNQSYKVVVLMFFPLYMCSLAMGFFFKSYFSIFVNVDMFIIFFILFIIIFGVVFGFSSFLHSLSINMSLYSFMAKMFFCYYLNISFKSMLSLGTVLYFFFDKGVLSLGFIERLNSVFFFYSNHMYKAFYSVGWLALVLFSYFFMFSVYIF